MEEPAAVCAPPAPDQYRQAGPKEASRAEWIIAAAIFSVLLLLRIRYNLVARFNSDEPQHLHVVWAWATGHLHYKEVFDNHMPLFQLLMAPVFRLFGERADILIWMRFAMLPLAAVTIWTVYKIGAIAFSKRVGLWASVIVAAWPGYDDLFESGRFFFKICEFRTDVLWTVFWLLGLLVAVAGRPTWRRSLVVGLIMGAAVGVSMKTFILLAALGISCAFVARLAGRLGLRLTWREVMGCLAAFLAGLCVIPAMIIGYFWAHDALKEMHYCVVTHNTLPGTTLWGRGRHHLPLLFGGGAATWLAVWAVFKRTTDPVDAIRKSFVVLIAFTYSIILFSFWPMVTPQNLIPSDAMLGICFAAALVSAGVWLSKRTCLPASVLLLGVVAGEIVLMLGQVSIFEDSTSRHVNLVRDVLKLTAPGQAIMDGKGETIYRPRAYYFVLETIANRRLERGLVSDTLIADLIRTKAPVLHDPDRMLPADAAWAKSNYVPVGTVDVLGKLLPPAKDGVISFDLPIAETYTIVPDHGTFSGTLDGTPFTGPRSLDAGHHEVKRARPNSRQKLVVMWAHAAELGYNPNFFRLAAGSSNDALGRVKIDGE